MFVETVVILKVKFAKTMQEPKIFVMILNKLWLIRYSIK